MLLTSNKCISTNSKNLKTHFLGKHFETKLSNQTQILQLKSIVKIKTIHMSYLPIQKLN